MKPRFVGRLGPADVVTSFNAVLGFVAVVTAFTEPRLAARIVLLAAIADGLDGVVARKYGGSKAGPHLDSLADAVSFGAAPAAIVYAVVATEWSLEVGLVADPRLALALGLPALFVVMGVVRLALYTAYDTDEEETQGVQTTLAAEIIGAAVLAGITSPVVVLAIVACFVYLLVAPIRYPDLLARDAVLMGAVHALAVFFPQAPVVGRAFPYALLTLGLAYMFLSPWFYWREEHGISTRAPRSEASTTTSPDRGSDSRE